MLKLLNFSCSRCLFPSDHSGHFLVNINIGAIGENTLVKMVKNILTLTPSCATTGG